MDILKFPVRNSSLLGQPLSNGIGGPDDFSLIDALKLFWKESLRKPGKNYTLPMAQSPEWYFLAERLRYGHHGNWLPHLLEFEKHVGEKVLCLGTGLGTDWIQYALKGSEVWLITPTGYPDPLVLQNFALRGLNPKHFKMAGEELPFPNNQFDIVATNELHSFGLNTNALIREMGRVLKPGGKVIALLPAKYNLERLLCALFPASNKKNDKPRVTYTHSDLKNLFKDFTEFRIHRRHLRRNDLPPLFRWVPIPLIQRLVGKFLIFKGLKPFALPLPSAAAA